LVRQVTRDLGGDPTAPWHTLSATVRDTLLNGRRAKFLGIFPFLERLEQKRYKQYIRVFLRQYQLAHPCPDCHGARLKPEVLAVRIAGDSIADAAARSVDELAEWLATVEFSPATRTIAALVLE